MPRRGQLSHRAEELYAIHRLEWEMKQRSLSYAQVADLLTEAGHPTQPTAIHRLLRGEPRRRLTLNEAAAIADIFDISLSELLLEKDVMLGAKANELLRELQLATRQISDALGNYRSALEAISAYIERGQEFNDALQANVAKFETAVQSLGTYYEDAVDGLYGMDEFLAGKDDENRLKGSLD